MACSPGEDRTSIVLYRRRQRCRRQDRGTEGRTKPEAQEKDPDEKIAEAGPEQSAEKTVEQKPDTEKGGHEAPPKNEKAPN